MELRLIFINGLLLSLNMIVKGHEFPMFNVKCSSNRRALQFHNDIIKTLRKLGISEDDIEVTLETIAIKRAPASALWFMDGYRLYYSYSQANKFIDNLYVVSKVLELEVAALLNGEKTEDDFFRAFTEEEDVEKRRKDAREFLGVPEDCLDMELINKHYKQLAKEFHPDMDGGSTEKFKSLNNAHKILKRELT